MQSVSGAAAMEAAFVQARQRGNEGLMAKDPASLYLPGRRGLAWLKLKKAYATLDVVVVGVEWGHGKRRQVLSDYTFAVRDERDGRAAAGGQGLLGADRRGDRALHRVFPAAHAGGARPLRTVEPTVVLEVAFDTIQPSDAARVRLRAALPAHRAHPRRQAGERDRHAGFLPPSWPMLRRRGTSTISGRRSMADKPTPEIEAQGLKAYEQARAFERIRTWRLPRDLRGAVGAVGVARRGGVADASSLLERGCFRAGAVGGGEDVV
jgi:hypothetical protein